MMDKKCYFVILSQTSLIKNNKKSQIMTKLNPIKSPKVPPQSATRELRGKASVSLRISKVPEPNMIFIRVMFPLAVIWYFLGSSIT